MKIERFAGRLALVLSVELRQEMRSEILFTHALEGARALLHHPHHIADDCQDEVVFLLGECGFGSELRCGDGGPLDLRVTPLNRYGIGDSAPCRRRYS